MQVETYEQTETTSAGPESDQEALKLIEQLGLAGQMERATAPVETRNPYRKMTRDEEQVYKLLMPKESKLEAYDDGPIPLRVLQVAAHAKGMFSQLIVWCPETGPKDDPILMGVNPDRTHSWMIKERCILARWGDCLLPFEKLREKAAALARERVHGALSEAQSQIQAALAALEHMATDRALKLALDLPRAYIST